MDCRVKPGNDEARAIATSSPVTRGLDHASRIYPTCAVNFRTRVNPSSDGPSFFAKLLEHIFVSGWIAGSSPAMTRRGRSLQALRSPAGLTRGSIVLRKTFCEEDGWPGQARP